MDGEIKVIVKDDTIRFIYKDELIPITELGKQTTKRASHVEPGDNGWDVNLNPVNGPTMKGFRTRQEALDAEVKWLEENNIPTPA